MASVTRRLASLRNGARSAVKSLLRTSQPTFATVASTDKTSPPRVLITGATGQIGMELISYLRARYGAEHVVASDVKFEPAELVGTGPYQFLDVTDEDAVRAAVVNHRADLIIHLASLLSAVGEQNPALAMKVNVRGTEAVLNVAAQLRCRVFTPSTIAVFGPSTPRDCTPNDTVLRPTTIYGTTKVYGELLGEYYARKYGVDYRALRYPGIISNKALPGGGTTDYAVAIYYDALTKGSYECFLGPDSALPMMYMPDCIRGTVQLIEAPASHLRSHVYNMTALSFTPAQLAASIAKYIPGFKITYAPDFRQAIADSWPRSIDDSAARRDWSWAPEYDTDAMTRDMLTALAPKLGVPVPAAVLRK